MENALLAVKDLSVAIQRNDQMIRLVDGISFQVNAHETLGMVGESGSGKTTTGLSLLRLTPRAMWRHTKGQVLFEGRDVLQMNDEQLRQLRGRNMSMVLQDPMASLNPAFTIGKQIEEAFAVHNIGERSERRTRAIEALRQVRIPAPEQRIDDYPHQISGGMKQRVVGAIALACQPKLLIADEPTTSLDVTIQAQYLQLLRELQIELGMAMLFITHDFGVIAKMCDRVCVLYAGQIVETAPVKTIFKSPAHWYSAALIQSVPKLRAPTERLISIAGTPPKVGTHSIGCRFAARCPNAKERCRNEVPPIVELAPSHTAMCWYPRDGAIANTERVA